MLESWLFQFFLKGNWQINTTLFSQYRKPVNQRTIFLNFHTPIFRSGKWCKGKAKILNHQIFDELFFFKTFLRTFAANKLTVVFLIAGAKIPLISYSPNFFNTFFYLFLYLKHYIPYSQQLTPKTFLTPFSQPRVYINIGIENYIIIIA